MAKTEAGSGRPYRAALAQAEAADLERSRAFDALESVDRRLLEARAAMPRQEPRPGIEALRIEARTVAARFTAAAHACDVAMTRLDAARTRFAALVRKLGHVPTIWTGLR